MPENPVEPTDPVDQPSKLPVGSIARSIAAAAFGVQSERNKQRDFSVGNYRHFIIGGIIFTVLFVASVALVVTLVLQSAASR